MPSGTAILFRRQTAALIFVLIFVAVTLPTRQVGAHDPTPTPAPAADVETYITPPEPISIFLAAGDTVRTLTLDEWRAVRHFAPERQWRMARIGWCESHLDPDAVGDGGLSIGAWQVQPRFWGPVPATLEAQAIQAERIAAEYGLAPWTTRDGCEGWNR
jgi:hypothetical protein